MMGKQNDKRLVARRAFLKGMGWASTLFLPAPIAGLPLWTVAPQSAGNQDSIPFADFRLTPHYPAKSPLDDILRLATPGTDEYVTEGQAFALAAQLDKWSQQLKADPRAVAAMSEFVDSSVESTALVPIREVPVHAGSGIEVVRRQFAAEQFHGRERFLREIEAYLEPLKRLAIADFEIYECTQASSSPAIFEARLRYEFVGTRADQVREERIGSWATRWSRDESGLWWLLKLSATEETVSRAAGPIFIDITSRALGQTGSYKEQMLHGADYWRTVLDGAAGTDVYGNNGVAVGDFDNDGWDDLYVCQPAGLPNRLYRNRGDGTFEDVTESCGVGILDDTSCALFADFQNKGLQDLLVVCGSGPLLFLNQGNGTFSFKPDAFKFGRSPQGTFTHAAIADYDRDGRLDIYFCLYSYYVGLDQYRYPVPYFDARNGPPNFLFHNQGDGVFRDQTEAAGLNIENNRYSFACSWGDCNGDGWPDLYVVNDFGRNNLYRNQGDGTFAEASGEARVDEVGAGMSACWLDFDNDGKQDIYAAGMWVAAGMRVFEQAPFHAGEPEEIRALYRRHMTGNSLYRNQGNGQFQNVAGPAGVEMGRWSWSTDSWDFDHDGYPDLYVANGYLTGPGRRDVSSFFWRQVVAKAPSTATFSSNYELGWNAINELVRSDSTWNGHERNNFFINNRDGTFSDISGVAGLDFRDDSRAFALADLDGDGRLEVVLKNRNAPQLRILRLAMKDVGNSIAFRLRGTKSNRDAIGAAITVTSESRRQTKYLQAGSGFLSQHTKELFFGLGKSEGVVAASIRWPGGLTQTCDGIPINHRLAIEEGVAGFHAQPYAISSPAWSMPGHLESGENLPASVETWLIEPLSAPQFSLPDVAGKTWNLQAVRGGFVLLNFWTAASRPSSDGLRLLQQHQSRLAGSGLHVVAVSVDDPGESDKVRSLAAKERFSFPVLLATADVAGIYNLLYRHMFDRRRDLAIPTSFLLDEQGMIVKVYQGPVDPQGLLDDLRTVPRTPAERIRKALPFAGTLYQGGFQRNDFTYGVAFFQHGYLDQAAESFQQVIAARPEDPEAHYNLGTLYLRRNNFPEARRYLEQTVKLRPNYPEAWNNLGMLDAQEGHSEEAVSNFQRSLQLRPDYAVAMVNLGNLYRRQRAFAKAQKLLSRAAELQANDPEVNYSLGMLYAQQDSIPNATLYLEKALQLRPDYPEALNNLGVLMIRTQSYIEAEKKFRACIQAAPDFDQAYLNLARLYVVQNDNAKAREVLRELLQRQPQHKMAQQALEMLE